MPLSKPINMIGVNIDEDRRINPTEARQKFMELIHEQRHTLSPHAKKQASARGFSDIQIYRCLETGSMVDGPYQNIKGNWESTFEGTVTGDAMRVAAALHLATLEYVVVITVVDISRR